MFPGCKCIALRASVFYEPLEKSIVSGHFLIPVIKNVVQNESYYLSNKVNVVFCMFNFLNSMPCMLFFLLPIHRSVSGKILPESHTQES